MAELSSAIPRRRSLRRSQKAVARRFDSAGPFTYVFLILVVLVSFFPLYWSLVVASHTNAAVYEYPPKLVPGSKMIPFMIVGATDARFFRRIGVTAYGYGLFSERISFADFASMFHGDNERVDVESLDLTTQLWEALIDDFLAA